MPGACAAAIDHEALASDVLRIDALSLIFPDGEIVRAPEGDALPLQVNSGRCRHRQSITFHAALPALKPMARTAPTWTPSADDARFVQLEHDTQDLFTHAAEAPASLI